MYTDKYEPVPRPKPRPQPKAGGPLEVDVRVPAFEVELPNLEHQLSRLQNIEIPDLPSFPGFGGGDDASDHSSNFDLPGLRPAQDRPQAGAAMPQVEVERRKALEELERIGAIDLKSGGQESDSSSGPDLS